MKTIRTVIVGTGYRGQGLIRLISHIDEIQVIAVSDPCPDDFIKEQYKCYSEGTEDYKRMITDNNPELVIIASPWQFHIEQALFAIQNNCNVAIEIKGGLSFDEYKPVIDAARKSDKKIYPLENTIFMREHMAMLNLINYGVLGDIIALKGGYRHDLRKLLINEKGEIGNTEKSEGIWRSKFYTTENGDLYPTHGIAPLTLFSGIGKTDKVTELTSFASRACGINEYIKSKGGDTSTPITMGDIIITQMKTNKGILITLTHDTTLPRPKTIDIEVQGSKGIWRGESRKIYIEGVSPYEEWEDDCKYIKKYEHRFWIKWGKEAIEIDTHHKGMDFIMLKAMVADIMQEDLYPVDIYDLAFWTSITPYSKKSIEEKRTISL